MSGRDEGRLHPLVKFLATGAYLGYSPVAPGTAGSLGCAILVWFFVPEVYFNVGRRLSVRYSHTYQRLDTLGGEEIYTANLAQARLQYMFTSRAFVRTILQYRWLHQNPLAYDWEVVEDSENLFTQFLFSYKLNARTVVFAGYSDNSTGLQTTGLVRTDRTFFIKLGYAWVL